MHEEMANYRPENECNLFEAWTDKHSTVKVKFIAHLDWLFSHISRACLLREIGKHMLRNYGRRSRVISRRAR